jgi:nicotinamidase-related amidase
MPEDITEFLAGIPGPAKFPAGNLSRRWLPRPGVWRRRFLFVDIFPAPSGCSAKLDLINLRPSSKEKIMTLTAFMKAAQTKIERSRPHAVACGVAFLQCLVAVVSLLLVFTVAPGSAQTIVDEWAAVKAPPPPELKTPAIDPKTTALLILDIQKQICNAETRPRCVASVPRIQTLLGQARAKQVPVIYSLAGQATPADIWKEVAPLGGEPVVRSGSDKFFKTDLEKILTDRGIKTVIVVGTAAQGAIIFTGTEAAKRGFQVIVPVDGMSSENTYFEQYTAYHLVNNPSYGRAVTLTTIDMVKF